MDKRYSNFDLLRIVSSVMVVLNHTNLYYYTLKLSPQISLNYIFGSVINIITRFAVPVFVMMSGMFVLNKPINNKKIFYKKSFVKIIIPYLCVLLLWQVIFFMKLCVIEHNYMGFFKQFIEMGQGNLWFMPMIFGLYLLAPYIQQLLYSWGGSEQNVLIIALMLWAIISQFFNVIDIPYTMAMIFAYMSYFLLGFWLNNQKHIKIKCYIPLFLVGLEFLLRFCLSEYYPERYMIGIAIYFEPIIVLFSVSVFILFRDMKIKVNLRWLSEKTLYIYLIHTIFLRILMGFCREKIILNNAVSCIVYTIIVWFCSLIAAIIMDNMYKHICFNWKRKQDRRK